MVYDAPEDEPFSQRELSWDDQSQQICEPSAACLDEGLALRFVLGLLTNQQKGDIEDHAARCGECRWLLSIAGSAVSNENDERQMAKFTAAKRSVPHG